MIISGIILNVIFSFIISKTMKLNPSGLQRKELFLLITLISNIIYLFVMIITGHRL